MPVTRWTIAGYGDGFRAEAERVGDHAVEAGLAPGRRAALVLAVHECLRNAWEHGTDADPAGLTEVEVEGHREGPVIVRIADEARAGPWRPAPSTPSLGERGRGRRLIAAGADEVRVESGEGRTCVELWLLPRAGPCHRAEGAGR
jgi:anti-sigma regulatory factor (Ser/Thr protein kinase)